MNLPSNKQNIPPSQTDYNYNNKNKIDPSEFKEMDLFENEKEIN
jgi:hypothetical protein